MDSGPREQRDDDRTPSSRDEGDKNDRPFKKFNDKVFTQTRDDRPRRNGRDERRSFNREDRPIREERNDQSFNRDDRPSFNRDRGDRPSFNRDRGDRPSFNRDDKPRSFGDRPRRDDRPSFNRDRGDRPSFNNDRGGRPSYNNDRGDRPSFNRDRGDRPSFNNDRGGRPSYNNDRGDRPSFNRDRGDRPSFNNDRGGRPSYNNDRGDRPQRQFNDRPRRDDNRSFNQDRGDRPSFNRDRGDRQFNNRSNDRPNSFEANDDVMKYYGVYSCKELVKKREDDIERVFLTEELVPTFKLLLSNLAKLSKGYKIVQSEELVKITDSTHHEGICIIAKKVEPILLNEALLDIKSSDIIAYLDGVENPHNIGAILRSAAHFGVTHLLMADAKPLAASGYRIARDGAESVKLISVEDPIKDLKLLKKCGFTLIATAPKDGTSLKELKIPKHSVLILGGETNGVSEKITELADHLVTIAGSGSVESLNVSNAFAVMAYHANS